jgi:V/A-type H+-transporting ATPase subunit K
MGTLTEVSTELGIGLLIASLPIAVVGLLSALYQSNVARAGITLLGKQPDSFGRGMMMAGVIETYALFALVISIFLVGF